MGRYPQRNDSHGSLKNLQLLINNRTDLLDSILSKRLNNTAPVNWISPLKNDKYAEYRDYDFINKLSINKLKRQLSDFWPRLGPQWDGLGKSGNKLFLIEAKAHIGELKSGPCKAKEESKNLINNTFNDVKKYLKVSESFDWTKTYYQYTNRLAHLYYLRVLNELDAYLIFIYFINDVTFNGPNTIQEWEKCIVTMRSHLGISDTCLDQYIINVFIDYNDLRK